MQTTAGLRASTFSNTVTFLEEVLLLEIVHRNNEKEHARFKLPSGEILEVFGPKNIWHPFSTPPAWEVIIADIRHKIERGDGTRSDQSGDLKP